MTISRRALGGTLFVVSHDFEPMRAAIDTHQHSRPFDPDAYLRVEDFAAALADAADWDIEVNETRPSCEPIRFRVSRPRVSRPRIVR